MAVGWREAWTAAAYGPGGFYARGEAPAAHFRTCAHASPLFAGAIGTLLDRVDAALGRPDPLDLVDVGAGRGELLAAVAGRGPAVPATGCGCSRSSSARSAGPGSTVVARRGRPADR